MRIDQLHRHPFVGLVLAAAAGVTVAELLPLPPNVFGFWEIAFPVASVACFWRPQLILTYIVVAVGFFSLHTIATNDTPGLQLASKLGERPRTVTALGIVTEEPKRGSSGFASLLFRLEAIEFADHVETTRAIWMVRWSGDPQIGDEIRFSGLAEPIEAPRNPGEFDMRGYLNRRDIRRQLFVRYIEDGALIHRARGSLILRLAQRSRDWIQSVLCRSLDDSPEVEAFLSGIALGVRHQNPEDIEEPFQQTGTLHLFAVAGLHVGIVASLLWILAKVAQLRAKSAAAVIIPTVLFYSAVTGLHVSSVRAALMTAIFLGGLFFERKVFAFNSLAAAAFLLLAWNTNELFSTGFQLSFAVVATIVLLADPLAAFAQRFTAPDPFLPRTLVSPLRRLTIATADCLFQGSSVSLAAWLGSLLLVLWYFHLITPISLLANLVVVPIAFFILAIGLLSILTAPLLDWVSVAFNNANWFLAKIVLAVVQFFAHSPGSHYYVGPQQLPGTPPNRLTVLDVATGGAVHLHVAGTNWLFDCGSERDYNRTVREYLHAAGVNRLNGLLLTHGDSLHIGGGAMLLNDFVPGMVIDNVALDRSTVHHRLVQDIDSLTAHRVPVAAGFHFNLSSSATAKVLFPPSRFAAPTADDETLVVQVAIPPEHRVLFMSDSGEATEAALLDSGIDLRSEILIKGQHHSGKSGSDRFLDAVRPKLIVATSRDFPIAERIDDQWAERLHARGIKLFRQDETGAVEVGFKDDGWIARAYVTGEIFRSDSR